MYKVTHCTLQSPTQMYWEVGAVPTATSYLLVSSTDWSGLFSDT